MDVFFVTTTVAIALAAVAFLVVMMYVVRLLRVLEQIAKEAREVVRDVREASERALDDARSLRERFSGALQGLSTMFKVFGPRATARPKRTKRSAKPSSSTDTN